MHFQANLRTERVAARVTPEQKSLLQPAAELTGRSLTDFILSSAQEAAEETPRTRRVASSAICFLSTLGRETAMKSMGASCRPRAVASRPPPLTGVNMLKDTFTRVSPELSKAF